MNVICHAGTRSVKVETVYFVRTPTYFARVADAPGKTKAINPFCATAQNQKRRYLPDYVNREDAVFAFTRESDIIEVITLQKGKTIAVLIVMTHPHDTAIVPHNDYCITFS